MEINEDPKQPRENARTSVERESVDISRLNQNFLSLRIGESIARLKVKEIRKVTNQGADDNLSGVPFKYYVETRDNKVLKVNVWTLWKLISAAIAKAGKMQCDLEIKHPSAGKYEVRVLY